MSVSSIIGTVGGIVGIASGIYAFINRIQDKQTLFSSKKAALIIQLYEAKANNAKAKARSEHAISNPALWGRDPLCEHARAFIDTADNILKEIDATIDRLERMKYNHKNMIHLDTESCNFKKLLMRANDLFNIVEDIRTGKTR